MAAFVAAAHRRPSAIIHAADFIIAGSVCSVGCLLLTFLLSTTLLRMYTSRSGIGMRTGHTSKHAPHREDA